MDIAATMAYEPAKNALKAVGGKAAKSNTGQGIGKGFHVASDKAASKVVVTMLRRKSPAELG